MLVGCGQITWRNVSEEDALSDIARAGYLGVPPRLTPERQAHEALDSLHRFGLQPAPPYYGAPFWRTDLRQQTIDNARRAAAFTRALGCTEMYVAAAGGYVTRSGRRRDELAGRVGPDDGLSGDEFRAFVEALNAVGEASLREGVRSCFHPHVGTVIETREEIEHLLDATDAGSVFLGPDTGHLAWAGLDVLAFCRRYSDRVLTLHLKDIDAGVRARGVGESWDYATFTARGIFIELGEGCVDFSGILDMLRQKSFRGWLIVETDVTQKPTAFDSARLSRDYLRRLGV